MKSLQTIQTISKIAKIICKVAYVFCIVGFCFCIVGIITTAAGLPGLKLGGVEIKSFLETEADLTDGALYSYLVSGALICVGEGILAKFAVHYLERELADGTPFTLDGAKELLRLGILLICIPNVIQIAIIISQKIFVKMFTEFEPMDFDPAVSVVVGALLLAVALICRYGAESAQENKTTEND